MELTAVLSPAEVGTDVAFNPETGTTTEGDSIEEALANLREATTLYLEEFPAVIKVIGVASMVLPVVAPLRCCSALSMRSSSRA